MNIRVSAHAAQRFKERFRLMFHKDTFTDNRHRDVLKTLFTQSRSVDFALKQCPGKYNALCTKHGRKVDIHRYKDLMLIISCVEHDTRVILTCLRNDQTVNGNKFI